MGIGQYGVFIGFAFTFYFYFKLFNDRKLIIYAKLLFMVPLVSFIPFVITVIVSKILNFIL